MRPQQLTRLLEKTIKVGLPILIKGAPGVGKSDIVAQAAAAAGAELVISHPVVSDPTDFKGLPAVTKGKAEFLPFGDLRQLMEANKLTVAFLDDLGQAPAVVQAAAMQLILGRRINGHKISDHVVFVAATNRREDRAGVTSILEPVKSRFATIVQLEAHIDDWSKWALDNDVPPELVAFVRFRPELLLSGEATSDIVNHPCPRTITFLGKLYAAGIQDFESLSGAAGEGFATEFLSFVKMWKELPSIDGILVDPEGADIPTQPAALYAVATALAIRVTASNADRVMRYANRLPEEFSTLLVRDALQKCKEAANNGAFIKWATEHQEVLT